MNSLRHILGKELTDIRRDRFFMLLLGFLTAIMLLSVVIAALDFRTKMGEYTLYLDTLTKTGSTTIPPAPQLYPLQLLRGSIEYLELLGALFAIILGYQMIAKDKGSGTIPLVFTRPHSRYSISGAKLVALAAIWGALTAAVFAVMVASLLLVGNASLTAEDYSRLALSALYAWMYLMFWSALSMGLVAILRRLSAGLIAALVIWLVIVLVIPQIGDTMDPDNQVPGGLFKSLQVGKADEIAVTAHFSGFETVRDQIEISSITKHYERTTFAFLGIKDQYNQQPLNDVWLALLPNTITLTLGFLGATAFALLATVKKTLLRKES
ncbi:polyphenol oxidoreductase [Subtercola boreus]|uniref:Polyphenol oxidoreductase n=1 Tax=Subtercola boreus TaxID=120213 RepID=A0A3E0VA31_9MICO|nr:ABC transporter permease subunit [Subtercola boreus]RFA06531.1 polyphenol oxidoreductase [Subtercola boreus]TQL46830.1 ABC-2 type transport system permease protein [Subtercola boreus]